MKRNSSQKVEVLNVFTLNIVSFPFMSRFGLKDKELTREVFILQIRSVQFITNVFVFRLKINICTYYYSTYIKIWKGKKFNLVFHHFIP